MQPYKQPHRLSGRADVALRRDRSQAPVSYPALEVWFGLLADIRERTRDVIGGQPALAL